MPQEPNWKNIQIEICYPQWNGRRMLFRQCQASDVRDLRPPMLGVETIRCGADAGYFVTRTNPEGRTYTDAMCERHAEQWGKLPIDISDIEPGTDPPQDSREAWARSVLGEIPKEQPK